MITAQSREDHKMTDAEKIEKIREIIEEHLPFPAWIRDEHGNGIDVGQHFLAQKISEIIEKF
jgi:hypothetical protein